MSVLRRLDFEEELLEELKRLPRWAKVAFAARCARGVQQFFQYFDVNEEERRSVDEAIAFAERQGARLTGPRGAYGNAALRVSSDFEEQALETSASSFDIKLNCEALAWTARTAASAADAADAASYSGDAACRAFDNAVTEVIEAALQATVKADSARTEFWQDELAWATNEYEFKKVINAPVISFFDDACNGMQRDLALVLEAAEDEEWDDTTAVAPERFDPLWGLGTPHAASDGVPGEYAQFCLDPMMDASLPLDEEKPTALFAELDAMTGLDAVKTEVRRLAARLKIDRQRALSGLPTSRPVLHFVFEGNPGTGKTSVARILGRLLHAYGLLAKGHVVETDQSGLVAAYLGQTPEKTAKKVEEALDGVLFIDEAYALSRAHDYGADAYGRQAIDTLVKKMEDYRDRLVVIVAGYPEPMQHFLKSNPGLESRFTRYLRFEDFVPQQLNQIFHAFAKEQDRVLIPGATRKLSKLVHGLWRQRTETFGNARAMRNLFEEICALQDLRLSRLGRKASVTELRTIMPQDIPLGAVNLSSQPKRHLPARADKAKRRQLVRKRRSARE
jgi:hypothetical protein